MEFEKPVEEDPFGLDEFLNTAKTGGSSSSKRPLDKVGQRSMHAGSAGSKDYEHAEAGGGSKRKKIDFEGGSKSRR